MPALTGAPRLRDWMRESAVLNDPALPSVATVAILTLLLGVIAF
jgi:hypothetical protein